ncbi:helix-turn-helix domain-containing protein [Micromonospora sp. ATA51]|uniref:helix-turn-helix domain-containing protein n=1 Tax=Micromonospora sp. ATA51 TaxID=2806098 RepID=UPI001A46015D|nr:hypothetical protein [Micromonospora sp. ATA51]
MLEPIGVRAEDERVYRELLSRPEASQRDLAAALDRGAAEVGSSLSRLEELGLVHRLPASPSGCGRRDPTSPSTRWSIDAVRSWRARSSPRATCSPRCPPRSGSARRKSSRCWSVTQRSLPGSSTCSAPPGTNSWCSIAHRTSPIPDGRTSRSAGSCARKCGCAASTHQRRWSCRVRSRRSRTQPARVSSPGCTPTFR